MTTATTHNMLPPGLAATTTTVVNSRSYTCARGSVLTSVPYQDADELEAAGWIKSSVGGSATTALRPTTTFAGSLLPSGYRFFDTTLGVEIIWDGAAWRNPASGVSV